MTPTAAVQLHSFLQELQAIPTNSDTKTNTDHLNHLLPQIADFLSQEDQIMATIQQVEFLLNSIIDGTDYLFGDIYLDI